MNDDFLTRFRRHPPPEFCETLYERITTEMNTQKKSVFPRIMFAAALGLALLAALVFSPTAQAALDRVVRQIGGVTFFGPDETEANATPVPESQITIVPDEVLSLAEAQEKLPYAISLPTWVPEGFQMATTVRISYFGAKYTPVDITWSGTDPTIGGILLTVAQPVNWYVDTNHLQEVQIKGQSAGLTGGNWNADSGQWSGDDLTLTWMKGDVMYRLSGRLRMEDLIKVAESIP
jgi:uncharacterized protein DUF4367